MRYMNQKTGIACHLVTAYGFRAAFCTENYSEKVKVFFFFFKCKSGLFSLLVRGIKLMSYSPPQAHQLLLVHVAIEKLTSSKQNKWQNATKGHQGVNRAVFKEDLPVGPLRRNRRTRQKRRRRFELLLGNWGSHVWNVYVSPRLRYPTLHVHWQRVTQFVFFFFFFCQCFNFVFPF